jgi:acetyl esterase/lipase
VTEVPTPLPEEPPLFEHVADGGYAVTVGEPVELWPDDPAPERAVEFRRPEDPEHRVLLRNVTRPTVTPYLPAPDRATGLGVIICPGGWHHFLAIQHEGDQVAAALAERGIAAFVLRYRVQPTADDHEAFLSELEAAVSDPSVLPRVTAERRKPATDDGVAALDLVRARGAQWSVDPDRVGLLGFSAGAFVAMRTALERPESHPAFVGAMYGGAWGGRGPQEGAPPLFTAWARDDELGALVFTTCEASVAQWRAVGSPVESHVFDDGGHGFGIEKHGTASDGWFDLFTDWLRRVPGASGSRS